MRKLKNKLFYLYSFFIYAMLAIIVFNLSTMYLEPDMKSFLISRFSANQQSNPSTIEVVVDDKTKEIYPDWNSAMYIEILDYFKSYAKPLVIGLDFFKPTNDAKYENLLKSLDNVVAIIVPKVDLSPRTEDEASFYNDFKGKYSLNILEDNLNIDTEFNGISEYSSAKNLGSAVIKPDISTNKIFSSSNILKVDDKYYPSLALKMYLYLAGTNDVVLNKKYIYIPKTELKIPIDSVNEGLINNNIRYYLRWAYKQDNKIYKSDSSHEVISAYRIVRAYRNLKKYGTIKDNDIDAKYFNDKIVFVGINRSGPYQDILTTPIIERHPGVDIQATLFDNLLNNEFLYNASGMVNFLVISLLSVLTFILIIRLKVGKSLTFLMLIDILFCLCAFYCAYNYYILNLSGALTVQLVTLIFGYSYKFINENRNKEKIKQAMGKYLSQDIMKNVVNNIDDLKLGGKRAVITVLFSDIRGFTSMSEKMSAEDVSLILNEYFAQMEPIITKYNGIINKYIGDAVMAIFGEPVHDENHPKNAVLCATEMLKKVEYLRDKWLFEGKPKFEIGIGINTGEVFIGNIGTENRMEYTAIGDTVNLASRIEGYNKVYKTNLLVSSSTYEHIRDIADVIKINEVQIRGKSKKMNIYEILRIDKFNT